MPNPTPEFSYAFMNAIAMMVDENWAWLPENYAPDIIRLATESDAAAKLFECLVGNSIGDVIAYANRMLKEEESA